MINRSFMYVSVIAALIYTIPTSTNAQDWECRGFRSSIPCVVDWYHVFDVVDRDETVAKATDVDSSGNVYVPGVSKSFFYSDRIILKYEPEGTPIYTFNITGLPWYIGSASIDDYYDFPWQRTAIDNDRRRLFVLFAAETVPRTGVYSYFLAAHDLDNGAKLSSWMGAVRHVGESRVLRGGLDIDSEGNVWTVLEDSPGVTVGLRIKKWDGNNGDNISPTNSPGADYFWVFSVNKQRHFKAFGVRKNDDKIYLAFGEQDSTGTKDLVVTLWDGNLQFLDRIEYTRELPAPEILPPPSLSYHNTTDHPFFSDGFVDDDGNILIGGTYCFVRWSFEFENDYVFPIAVKYRVSGTGSSLDTMFEYIETERYKSFYHEFSDITYDVKLTNGPNNDTFLWMFYMYRINNSGNFVDYVILRAPYGVWPPVEDPPGSGCRYFTECFGNNFKYHSGRLITSGFVRNRWLNQACAGDEDVRAYTVAYYSGLRRVCCVIRPFDWFSRFEMMQPWLRDYFRHGRYPAFRAYVRISPSMFPSVEKEKVIQEKEKLLSYLTSIYKNTYLLLSESNRLEFPEQTVRKLTALFNKVPTGRIFNKTLQADVIESLKEFISTKKLTTAHSSKLIEAVNAVELERHEPSLIKKEVPSGEKVDVQFPGYASLRFDKVRKPEICSLKISGGLPATAEGFEPGWPVVTYTFDYAGKVSKMNNIIISFNLSNIVFDKDMITLHIFQWDGKTYKDITTAFDLQKRIVTGKTDELATFVVMSSSATRLAGKKSSRILEE